jgi:hypothetical protein
MKTLKTVTILCAAIVLFLPGLTKASPVGTVDIAHDGYGASDGITIWGGGHYGSNVYSGVYMLDKTADTGQGDIWPDGQISGFCMELHQWASSSTLKYDVVELDEVNNSFMGGLIGTEKADYIAELWGRFYNPEWADGGPYTSEERIQAEAFAAAIWEIIYEDLPTSVLNWDVTADGSYGFHGFYAQNVDSALANSWLHALDGTGPKAELMAFVNEGKQDYIVQVPEPATVCLLGLGGLVFLRKRKA